MEANSLIKKQYRSLENYIKDGNKTRNEKNEVIFFVQNNQLFAGVEKEQKILICRLKENLWEAKYCTAFHALEDFITDFLNVGNWSKETLTVELKLAIFKLPD